VRRCGPEKPQAVSRVVYLDYVIRMLTYRCQLYKCQNDLSSDSTSLMCRKSFMPTFKSETSVSGKGCMLMMCNAYLLLLPIYC